MQNAKWCSIDTHFKPLRRSENDVMFKVSENIIQMSEKDYFK